MGVQYNSDILCQVRWTLNTTPTKYRSEHGPGKVKEARSWSEDGRSFKTNAAFVLIPVHREGSASCAVSKRTPRSF